MKSAQLVLLFALTLILPNADAASKRGGGGGQKPHSLKSDLTVGGSISAPSTGLGVFTNPAALAQISGVDLALHGGAPKLWTDATYRGGLQAGLGFVGAAVFADREMKSGGDQSTLYGGVGLEIPFVNLEIGAAMRRGFSGPSQEQDWIGGMVFSPTGFIQIGVTALSHHEAFSEVGAGAALVLVDGMQLVIDSAADEKGKNLKFKPGIKLYNPFGGFSMSFGTGDRDQFSKGFTAGSFVRLGMNSQVEVAYNHGGLLPKYYAALSMGF